MKIINLIIDSDQALKEWKIKNKENGLVLHYLQRRCRTFWKRFELDIRIYLKWGDVLNTEINSCLGYKILVFSDNYPSLFGSVANLFLKKMF